MDGDAACIIDYLDRLEHEANRLIFMISYNVLPRFESYLSNYKFWFYSTSHAKKTIKMIKEIIQSNAEYMPELDFIEKVRHGGIQKRNCPSKLGLFLKFVS